MIERNFANNYIAKNESFAPETNQVLRFKQTAEDPQLVEINTALAHAEGIDRTIRALHDVEAELVRVTELLKAYKAGELTREEYIGKLYRFYSRWADSIGSSFYMGYRYESGTKLQFVQLLRALQILTDTDFDIDTLDEPTYSAYIASIPETLSLFEINCEFLIPEAGESRNNFFRKVFQIHLEFSQAAYIIAQKNRQEGYILTDDERIVRTIDSLLSRNVQQVFKEYARKNINRRQRIRLFLILGRVRKELHDLQLARDSFKDEYWRQNNRAEKAGYSFNVFSDRYEKTE